MKRSVLHPAGFILICTLLIVLPFLFTCSHTARSHPKSVMMDESGAYFAGHWRVTADTGLTIIPNVNNTTCKCNKLLMKCREVTAMLYNPGRRCEYLDVKEVKYDVIEWSDTHIRGVGELPVADIEIRISLPDKTVEKTYRETNARGSDNADPKISKRYVLE